MFEMAWSPYTGGSLPDDIDVAFSIPNAGTERDGPIFDAKLASPAETGSDGMTSQAAGTSFAGGLSVEEEVGCTISDIASKSGKASLLHSDSNSAYLVQNDPFHYDWPFW
jgi:hypothetical protein